MNWRLVCLFFPAQLPRKDWSFVFTFSRRSKLFRDAHARSNSRQEIFFEQSFETWFFFSLRLSEMMFPPTTCCSCAWMMNLTLERRIQPSFVSSLDHFWAKIWAIFRVHFLVRKTYWFSVFIGSSSFLSSSARFENRDVCCCCCTHTRHWPDEMSLSTL